MAWTMRGVPARRCDIFPAPGARGARVAAWPWCWRARQRDTAGTAGGPVAGVPCTAAPRAVGFASEGRGGSCRPATARPGWARRLRRVTLAALPSPLSRPSSLFTAEPVRPGGRRNRTRRRRALSPRPPGPPGLGHRVARHQPGSRRSCGLRRGAGPARASRARRASAASSGRSGSRVSARVAARTARSGCAAGGGPLQLPGRGTRPGIADPPPVAVQHDAGNHQPGAAW